MSCQLKIHKLRFINNEFDVLVLLEPLKSDDPPIKFGMYQPKVSEFFDEKGAPLDPQDALKRFDLFFDELLWYARNLKH